MPSSLFHAVLRVFYAGQTIGQFVDSSDKHVGNIDYFVELFFVSFFQVEAYFLGYVGYFQVISLCQDIAVNLSYVAQPEGQTQTHPR